MPCNSDYLDPNSFEKACQHTAKLIMFASSQLTMPVPMWVLECANSPYGAPKGQQGGDQRLVPMLCEIVSNMNETQKTRVVYDAHRRESRQLADWWEAHQEADRLRIFREKEEAEQKRIRSEALAKLTQEEKTALGIRS